MPSPFPGMDPYLESPRFFKSFHSRMITYLEDQLNRILPAGFAAQSEERLYVLPPQRKIYADFAVVSRSKPTAPPVNSGGVHVLEADTPRVVTAEPEEIHEAFLEIITLGGDEQVVAVIEILSPANKAVGNTGRDTYLRKQDYLLNSDTHLMEIDLLRAGAYTVATPEALARAQDEWDYIVSLHDATRPVNYLYFALTVHDRLPRVALPLTPGVPPVILDIQAAMAACYDVSAFPRRVDYEVEPVPPLSTEDAVWADTLLREKGLRS